ncbi:hypothetical protein [Geothrix sp. 21YS21S-2]|uniref:hypothetical protein n=1 Tax=Geothrix sp. 21YS21S-2 TaxID=3068893 RepID=UPI0027B8B275|nr:hypothetical protein [Geothrix sp. 21YS21S-2]
MRLPILILCALTLPLAADGLDALRARLQKPAGAEALKASVQLESWNRRGDEKKPVISQGRATAWAECGPQGIRLSWGRDLLAQALQEARLRTEDPEKTTPTREAMAGLDALSLQNYFDPGPQLLQDLDKATLLEERPDTLDGRALKLLSLKLEPRMGARDRKYVKELDATAKVWVDAEGLPVAAETRVKLRGKALLVISFSSEQHDAYRFARVGGRLVTVHHLHESSGSGGGESGQSRRVTTLAFSGS